LAGSRSRQEATKGVILTEAKWPLGTTIQVSFLDGEDLGDVVMRHANEWLRRTEAELTFERVKAGGQIRVSFRYAGSWSSIGNSCLEIKDDSVPTMNFGWLRRADAQEARRVVLHEFGHALGLLHEHQSPAAEIEWDKDRVVTDLQAGPGWTAEVIDRNLFVPAAREETQFSAFDPRSIMIYPIPKEWLRKGEPVALNADLSDGDVKFVRGQYRRQS